MQGFSDEISMDDLLQAKIVFQKSQMKE